MKIEQNLTQPNIKQLPLNSIDGKISVKKDNKSTPNFTGGFDMALRFLDTNPAWGADAVDLCFMVVPRTATDFGRGSNAGFETMRREGMGTANHSSVPLYGALAGMAVAAGLNRIYFADSNVKANKIYADSETLHLMGKLYKQELDSAKNCPNAKPLKEFLVKYFNSYEALSPNINGKYISLESVAKDGENVAQEAADIIVKEIEANKNKPAKEAIATAKAKIISALGGVENNFRIIAPKGSKQHTSRYTIDTIVDNAYKLGSAFNIESIKDSISNSNGVDSEFIKAMKKMNMKRSLIGIGIASAIGISAQPFNMYLTRRKTGESGFVGGGKEDTSVGFKIRKSLAGLAFFAMALASIGNPKKLVQNLQFKGVNPTINQFKFIYGITILSRFLSSRNDNELAETSVKDTLGFINWLILGNFVQRLVAQGLDKDLIKKDGNGIMKWITGSVLKSRDEILHASLGKKAFKDGKALTYKQMVNIADKATKVKLRKLSIAQIVNYAYTGLVLGIGIPKLNIYLTGRREAKKAAKEQQNKQQTTQVSGNISSTGAANSIYTQANKEFMSKFGMV